MLGFSVSLLLQFVLPCSLLIWQRWQPKSWLLWGLKTILISHYLIVITFAPLWLWGPWYVGYIYLGLFTLITLHGLINYRIRRRIWGEYWEQGSIAWSRIALFLGIILALTIILWNILQAYSLPNVAPVTLSFPLKNGTYYIANGGNSVLLNAHRAFLTNRKYRGNSYAVDILKLNRWGLRATKAIPTRLSDYNIFGASVYSPCSGRVLNIENALPDLPPPQRDRQHLAGNYVLLACQSNHVLLAHLQQGTVRVTNGVNVTQGQLLAKVGNSGNTDEPHLHIHAQRPGSRPGSFDAEPLPMFIDDQFLVRNQRVTR
jgi:Peptidase family M23